MQEKYLGDSHDYAKYALLNHFTRQLGLRVGLNWYLTESSLVDKAGNNDGEKRHHFGRKTWRGWEIDILQKLAPMQLTVNRRMDDFYNLGVLPAETIYFDDYVPMDERERWHQSAVEKLSQADLVFIDPDNGFAVASMTRRTSPKYALYHEAKDYLEKGKILVAIQFARQCDPIERGLAVRRRISQHIGSAVPLPIIRARMAPNLLFVTAAPDAFSADVAQTITSFAEGREKIELIP